MFRTRAIASIAQPLRAASVRTYASTVTVASTRSNASAPLLGNIEASWKDLSAAEQAEIQEQIAELEKKDWKELSVDEKKAGEWEYLWLREISDQCRGSDRYPSFHAYTGSRWLDVNENETDHISPRPP